MAKKSEFRKLMEKVFEQNGISLKEWDDPEELNYAQNNPGDHTGEGHITIEEFEIPVDEFHMPLVKKAEDLYSEEDLYNYANYEEWLNARKSGDMNMNLEYDKSKIIIPLDVEYEISGYPYEEIGLTKVNFGDVDITSLLTNDDKYKIQEYLDKNIEITDNYKKDVRDTYYGGVL